MCPLGGGYRENITDTGYMVISMKMNGSLREPVGSQVGIQLARIKRWKNCKRKKKQATKLPGTVGPVGVT